MALEKEQKPSFPRGQFLQILLFMAAIFVLFDQRLRTLLGDAVGFVLNPIIGFNHQLPTLTILLAAVFMVAVSTGVRHFFIDWIHMARIQNTMRSFQKALREARMQKDQKKVEKLQKVQPKLMGLQGELSSAQMKPMAFTFLVVIPLFAWLSQFILEVPYAFFTAPWNDKIDMFSTDGILFGTSVLPHWLLFYTAISIPFGAMVQKGLKAFTWRDKWQLIHEPAPSTAESGGSGDDSA